MKKIILCLTLSLIPSQSRADDCTSIITFGGSGNGTADNVAALNSALSSLGSSGGCISFPSGKFSFSGAVVYSFSGSSSQTIRLQGSGPDGTILYWPNATNGLIFKYNGGHSSVEVRDLAVTAANSTGNTGIWLQRVSSPGAIFSANVIDNVQVRADNYGSGGWGNGLFVQGVPSVNVNNSIFSGASNQGTGILLAGLGVGLEGIVYNISNTSFLYLDTGLFYGPDIQGVSVSQCNFTIVNIGIQSPGSIPSGHGNGQQLSVVDSQFGAYNPARPTYGIYLPTPINGTQISNNYFAQSDPNSWGINMSTFHFSIVGNNFFGPSKNSSSNAIGIANTNSGTGIITGNIFTGYFVGVYLLNSTGSSPLTTNVNVQSNSFTNVTYATGGVANATNNNKFGGGSLINLSPEWRVSQDYPVVLATDDEALARPD